MASRIWYASGALFLSLGYVMTACSSSESPQPACAGEECVGSGGTSGIGGGGGAGEGGTPGAGGTSSQTSLGRVSVLQFAGPNPTTIVGALFTIDLNYTASAIGPCTVSNRSMSSPADPQSVRVSGGELDVTLGPAPSFSQTLSGADYLKLGDVVSYVVTQGGGSSVPSFNESLTYPGGSVLSAPLPSSLPAASDWQLAFSKFSGLLYAVFGAALECRFDASTGTATIPAEVVSAISSSGGSPVSVEIFALSEKKVKVGDFDVLVMAMEALTDPQGNLASAYLSFQ